jgi:hypothetical protein
MAISTGKRERAREWSRAIYNAFPQLAGIRYGSSMDANRPAFALYERAKTAIPARPLFDERLSSDNYFCRSTTIRIAGRV